MAMLHRPAFVLGALNRRPAFAIEPNPDSDYYPSLEDGMVGRIGRKTGEKIERLARLRALTVAGIVLKLEAAVHRGAVSDPGGLIPKVTDAPRLDALRLSGPTMTDAR